MSKAISLEYETVPDAALGAATESDSMRRRTLARLRRESTGSANSLEVPFKAVEVGGVEPPSFKLLVGLLRAQPVGKSQIDTAHRQCVSIPAPL